MLESIESIWSEPWARALGVAIASFAIAWVVEVAIIGFLARLASHTETDADDVILALLRRPIYISLVLLGLDWAVRLLEAPEAVRHTARASLLSVAIVMWSFALLRIGAVVLKEVARRAKPGSVLQARTLPLFDIVSKTAVLAGAIYLGMIAWDIDVGAWLASAGIVGIAVGFAARDSLANYFAGVFIIADAPYKLGDVITLDDGTRGRVTDIGLRSTRLHTRDEIEINIPNSVLGNMRIENRTAGPSGSERIAVDVGVAYGTDVHRVIEVLSACTDGIPHLLAERGCVVRFVAFGESSLDFRVFVWIDDPALVDDARHDVHVRVYEALNAARIEIPFPQRDLHVKELPALGAPST